MCYIDNIKYTWEEAEEKLGVPAQKLIVLVNGSTNPIAVGKYIVYSQELWESKNN